jgi:ABC-2 type transport system ATP-binding protein
VLLSSHVLEEVERICDHVVALDAGRLVAHGSIAELAGSSGGVELELVEVDDRPEAISEVERFLASEGLTVHRSGAVLTVNAPGTDGAETAHGNDGAAADDALLFDATVRAVAGAGARVRRLVARRRTLDDVFGGSSTDAEDAGVTA